MQNLMESFIDMGSETASVFLRKLGFASPYAHCVQLPAEAELAVRSKDGKDYIFIMNYMSYAIEINIKEPMTDLLSGNNVLGPVELDKFGIMVLEKI